MNSPHDDICGLLLLAYPTPFLMVPTPANDKASTRVLFSYNKTTKERGDEGLSKEKPLYVQAFADYKQGLKYKEIAEKYNVTVNTVKSWKTRHWNDEKSMRTKTRKVRTQNRGGAPKGNTNAKKHGLFERYLPDDTLDIIQDILGKSPLDLLWDQIVLAYAAIIRSQKLMYVRDEEDHTIIKSGYSAGETIGERYSVESAFTKQSNYLNSLSRVQAQLNNMIKQYDKMVREDPLATEEQALRIAKLKADIEQTQVDDSDKTIIVTNEDEMKRWMDENS